MAEFKAYNKLFVIDGSAATISTVHCADGWRCFSMWAETGSRMMLPDGGAVTCIGTVCEYGGTFSRFGRNSTTECRCTDVKRLYAGAWGEATLCAEHEYVAHREVDEQLAAEGSGASALRHILEDERRMAR